MSYSLSNCKKNFPVSCSSRRWLQWQAWCHCRCFLCAYFDTDLVQRLHLHRWEKMQPILQVFWRPLTWVISLTLINPCSDLPIFLPLPALTTNTGLLSCSFYSQRVHFPLSGHSSTITHSYSWSDLRLHDLLQNTLCYSTIHRSFAKKDILKNKLKNKMYKTITAWPVIRLVT